MSREKLSAAIESLCPGWEVCEPWPQTPQGWLDRLTDAFHVTGYYDREIEESVEFDVCELELEEASDEADALDPESLSQWDDVEFSGELTDSVDTLVGELRALKQRLPDVNISVHKITAGMKYCGTIEYGLVRITLDGVTVDIRPEDVLWETQLDRTFGPMWESPDDL